jgi:hypothetical protein
LAGGRGIPTGARSSGGDRRPRGRANENAPEPAGYEAGSRGALEGGEVLRRR